MICVSLGRTRHSAFLKGHQLLAEQNAELVELRVDWLRTRPDIGRLLKDRPTPVVVTCRRKEDRGLWRGTEEQRLATIREAIVSGAEYVDVEVDVAKQVPRYGDTKRIVSYHNFENTPEELFDIYEKMKDCDADVIKLITMANTPADNVRVLELLETAEVPTVAFCMGEFGTLSRILCGRYGAPFTYAGFSRERELAPGQLTLTDVRNLYGYNRITKATRVFGVIGDPISHSLSPVLHNAAFRETGFDGVYLPLRIPAELLDETIREFNKLKVEGYSVTIPHKEAALHLSDSADEKSDEVGAANTLFRKDNQWHATNTDYDAIVQTVLEGLGSDGDEAVELDSKRVLIMGAGGVARAAAQAMLDQGASVVITNRTRKRSKSLATELDCKFLEWSNRGAEMCDVLINCTSVGMHPNLDDSPYEEHWLRQEMLVFDTVYTPENTLLLKQARERGCRTVSGIRMFVRQAAKQFELFTNKEAPLAYMEETLRRYLAVAG